MTTSLRASAAAIPLSASDHVRGTADAPIVIVEYCDFECPSCAQAAPALRIVKEHFGSQVCLVFRHYPLAQIHPHAMMAAEAAEAASAQGQFWPMHDALFRHELHLGRERLLHCARAVGLDMTRFERELSTHEHLARVEDDVRSAQALRVMSTPALFVNGEHCDVSFGMERLHRRVEEMLASMPPATGS